MRSLLVLPGTLLILGMLGGGKYPQIHDISTDVADPPVFAMAAEIRDDTANSLELNEQTVAQQLALLPQDVEDIFPATVIDTVLIGRHPHIGKLRWESAEDYAIANRALATMGLADLAQRDVLTLSGGERRRLSIAQILVQEPEIYLLDEPTNHLDPQHQLDAMRIFRTAADNGAGVIATLHDINLAVRFADRCLLLFGDGRWELGPSAEILSEERLGELFATPMESVVWRNHNLFVAGNP